MPPKRSRVVFDPEAAKRSAKKKKEELDAIREIEEAAMSLLRLVEKYDAAAAALATSDCNPAALELCLVAKVGLSGACWVNLATKVVPENHPCRLAAITSMVNFSFSEQSKQALCSADVGTLVKMVDRTSLQAMKECYLLENYSKTSATFLTPPVSTCLNPACSINTLQTK